MGRGQEPHVHLAVAHVPEPAVAQVLHDLQQLGLHLQVDVPDLVEEHRPAVGDLQEALLGRHRSREGALLVSEQLRLQEVAREPGAVEVDEGFFRARPVLVQPAREHALPGPRLPADEDGDGRGDDPRRVRGQLADDRALAEEGIHGLAGLHGLAGQGDLPHAAVLQRALDDDEQGGQLHRLREELFRALLDGLDREVDAPVPGEEHHRDARVLRFHAAQHVEAVAVGQGEVHDGGVHGLLAQDGAHGGRCPPRHRVALAGRNRRRGRRTSAVVDGHDLAVRHAHSSPGRRGDSRTA